MEIFKLKKVETHLLEFGNHNSKLSLTPKSNGSRKSRPLKIKLKL